MAAAGGSPDPGLDRAPEIDEASSDRGVARREQGAVVRLLYSSPWEFEFFQAVRLLQWLYPDRALIGKFAPPASEAVRFSAHRSIAFPASQIQGLERRDPGQPLMVINFMGLIGPLGVLPLVYSAYVMERERAKDSTLADFLDLFSHRAVSLFYRAWEKYRFPIAYERDERDRFSQHMLDLIGLGTRGLQDRQSVSDDSLIYYSGLLGLHPRSELALRSILMDYFEVPVEIEQFVGAWYSLSPSDQCRFQSGNTTSEQLAVGTVVGDEIWDPQSAARIRLGPLTLRQYLDFLPNGSAHEPLRAILKFFSSGECDFEVQLILRRDQVPACELGSSDEVAPQLGWITWMKTAPFGRDPGDTILRM